jgi:hypothetical protein
MLNNNSINILTTISELFCRYDIRWRLTGSSNLCLQNIPVVPKDIDILVFSEDATKVQSVLASYCKEPLQYRESSQFRSFFGKFAINDIDIEIMSNVEIMKNGKWHIITALNSEPILIKIGDLSIPCVSLKDEYKGYVLMGRVEKAELIKKVMKQIS